MKRQISFAVLSGLLLLAAQAAQAQFTFLTNADNTLTVTGYTGPPWAVNIPSATNGRPVTIIADQAFANSPITSVVIPGSITKIGDGAFWGCGSLANVTMTNGITSIGDGVDDEIGAFWDCASLTSVQVPGSVTNIAYATFEYCPSLTAINVDPQNSFYGSVDGVLFNKTKTTLVEFPDGLIGSYTIPGSVVTIGERSFGTSSLTNVTVPASVISIADGAFENGSSLMAITVDPQNSVFSSVKGVLFDHSQSTLVAYPGGIIGSYVIPDSVLTIGYDAFSGCRGIYAVLIPQSVTTIAPNAFNNSGLVSVTIPGGVTNLGHSAFANCFSLGSVTIGSGLSTLPEDEFGYCTSLTNVCFEGKAPTSNTADASVFSGDPLTAILYVVGAPGWGSIFYGVPTAPCAQCAGVQVTASPLPKGTNGLTYSEQLFASNGEPPYGWSLISGSLPSGLTLATNGLLSGMPGTIGTFNFTVEVTDALSATATMPLSLTVVGPPSFISQPTNNFVMTTVGNNVSFAVSVAGTGPFNYQWQLNGTNLPSGIITTVAGNGYEAGTGNGGYSGDEASATNAELNVPDDVTVGTTGNLFIADTYNGRIREVTASGIITTVAGGGRSYPGDGGAATNAALYIPAGVAVDSAGNLFIAVYGHNRIREVGMNANITTVAGNGTGAYSGDGGAATNAEINGPAKVAVDAIGNLYVADLFNNRVRKVETNGIITTAAGNGTAGYSGDGGAATNAELSSPDGIAVDAAGNLFIADGDNNVIRRVGTGGIVTTVAGNGTQGYFGDGGAATNAEINSPAQVAVSAIGDLFIADWGNNVIRKVGTDGIITTVAGNGTQGYFGDGGMAINAELYHPIGVAVDSTGNLFIADQYNNCVRKVVIHGPTLALNDAGFGNAGAYDVVVSNPYGSVTSSVVKLTITLPSVILTTPQIALDKTSFTFLLSGPSGGNYVLQASTNLLNWSSVSTSTVPAGGTVILSNAISGFDCRFYRAYLQ